MSFIEIIKGLRQCPREFWLMIVLNVFFSYSYFTIAPVLTVYLTSDHGFDDVQAGEMYSGWAVAMSLYQFVAGPIIDWMQIRRSLIFGALMATIGSFMLALTFDSPVLIGLALFFFIPLGSAFLLTPVNIGGKRYSNNITGAMNIVFSLFYSGQNLGALLAGVTIESIRDKFGAQGVAFSARHATTERLTILSGAMITAIGGLLAALLVSDVPLQTRADLEMANVSMPGSPAMVAAAAREMIPGPVEHKGRCRKTCEKTVDWLRADVLPVLRNYFFRRLLLFTVCLIGVRTVFRHLDTTFPKVILRVFGPEAHYGALYSINPFMLIFITPFVGAFVARFDIFNVMIFGTLLAASSMFIMGVVITTVSVIVWSIIFTLGEAVYSPATNIYVMAVAPEGREGIYASLVNAPNLMAKILVGPMSGYELQNFCPKQGPSVNCNRVWIDIGAFAMTTPLLLAVLKRFIHTDQISVRINARLAERFASAE